MLKVAVLCFVAAVAAGLPQRYAPPPGSAPGGISSAFGQPAGPPPGSAPGGIVSSFRPPSPPSPAGVPPGSAPGGIVSSFRPPSPPPRPSPGSAPGGISSSFGASAPPVPILQDEREGPDQLGNYKFNFETGDGISRYEEGSPQGETGAVASQGGWSFTFPDGTPAVFTFVADANGFRVESDLLPTPPPLPPHAIAQIEKARQEDAAAAAASGGRPSLVPQHRPAYSN
ncbi:endocuticle structural glycoprotein SgAbd-8 [Penaeus vannamei]|uniref:endocuticle structural glycoprotein SgAbd-8 n=1 Tax=Penaeus vannamei TaxID=6689 RepID=UPI000F659366|nr:endocuticle structural glycoprotein SgAbd-8-like [Penaeus vannamei]